MMIFRDRRQLWFIREVSGVHSVVRKMRIRSKTDKITVKNLTFDIDGTSPAFKHGRTFVYIVDMQSGQLTFKEPKSKVSAQLVNVIFTREIARQLVSRLKTVRIWDSIMYILLSIGFGSMLGYIIGNALPL